MSDFKIVDPLIGAVPVTQTDSVQKWPLGYIARGEDKASNNSTAYTNKGAGQFVYVQGSNASSAGAWVAISNNQAVLAGTVNSTSPSPVAVACGVLSATNQYGWAMIQGYCDFGRGTNSTISAAGGPVYIAAGTAGIAGTVSALGNRVLGAVFANTYSTSQSLSQSVYLMFPQINQVTALN